MKNSSTHESYFLYHMMNMQNYYIVINYTSAASL